MRRKILFEILCAFAKLWPVRQSSRGLEQSQTLRVVSAFGARAAFWSAAALRRFAIGLANDPMFDLNRQFIP
jgi:hypothetical protein